MNGITPGTKLRGKCNNRERREKSREVHDTFFKFFETLLQFVLFTITFLGGLGGS